MKDLAEHVAEAFGDIRYTQHEDTLSASIEVGSDDRWWKGWDNRANHQAALFRKRAKHRLARLQRQERYSHCATCSAAIKQPSFMRHGKRVYAGVRKFCNPRCRDQWWKTHHEGP